MKHSGTWCSMCRAFHSFTDITPEEWPKKRFRLTGPMVAALISAAVSALWLVATYAVK